MKSKFLSTIVLISLLLLLVSNASADVIVAGSITNPDGTSGIGGATVDLHTGSDCLSAIDYTVISEDNGDYIFVLDDTAYLNGDTVTVCASKEGVGSGSETGEIQQNKLYNLKVYLTDVAIPEFPKIAIPVAAIIGLMFIFSIRNKE